MLWAVLVACLAAGCVTQPPSGKGVSRDGQEVEGSKLESIGVTERVQIFAGEPFYRERAEPEEELSGTLLRTEVREGPDTRDMPFELQVDGERLSVYVADLDLDILRPFVDSEVNVTGKQIDLRDQGFGYEIWIATIELAESVEGEP